MTQVQLISNHVEWSSPVLLTDIFDYPEKEKGSAKTLDIIL